ncbi:MAG: tRNA pseudouridine(55) synthase TruB [Candidatus Omnitrophota bacterium]|nr:tRNA pseudouridine(55) synthase TruB [Candidatus Omnitrophota bacterium]
MDDVCGILVVDKKIGVTSHDVVARVRKNFGVKKVGHAGTLDPNATGVLVLLLGKFTKMSGIFLNQDKEYTAVVKLGERTESGDSDGKVVSERPVTVKEKEIRAVVLGFKGESEQVPPMFSAKKVKGKKLYDLARKGLSVKREPNIINIKEIEVTRIDLPHVGIRVACGKGTYIRQIADDMGEKLGCGAHLTELRRIRSGDFTLSRAIPFDALENMDAERFSESIIRI